MLRAHAKLFPDVAQVAADVERLCAIAAVLDRDSAPYHASLDGNEQYENAQGVAQLVAAIRGRPALARLWQSIRFIEQPIARKLALQVDIRGADLGKPVIIDESDGELGSFVQARACGYAGVSSKTCKGLYKSILNAARCATTDAHKLGAIWNNIACALQEYQPMEAYKAFRKSLEIYPQQERVKKQVEELVPDVEGRGI